ncbi:hypothetical protein [Kamptonema formosum]|nr:hypothetical protein [Oscillatoria sp. PCC 10802]
MSRLYTWGEATCRVSTFGEARHLADVNSRPLLQRRSPLWI